MKKKKQIEKDAEIEDQPGKRDSQSESEGQEKKPFKIGLVLKILLILIVIGGATAGAFFLTKKVLLPANQQYQIKKAQQKKEMEIVEKKIMGPVFVIKDITVNTLGSTGRRFIMAEFALETKNPEVMKEVEVREPQFRDMIIKYMRQYNEDEILDINFQESSRTDLTNLVNERLTKGKIDSLYYVTLVVQ
jgi:flagellar basal body-associated protein FliL